MNKKALLVVLPALLVLSACQIGPKSKDNNIFLEDTLAHEELFGGVDFCGVNTNIRKVDPVEHPDNDPTIGIQSQQEEGNKVSFRFVAAVSIAPENLESTVANWTRTVSDKDGNAIKTTTQVPVTTAYTSLSNAGGAYTIDQFNSDHGNASYTHFVVYTLRNIPNSYSDAFVSAFLTLSRQGADDVVSKAIATTVDESRQFAYAPYDGAFFIRGTMNANPVPATRIRDNDGNKAVFEDVLLDTTDSFVIEEFYNSKLELHGSSIYAGTVADFDLKNVDGKIGANYKGKYNFYLKYNTDHNELYATGSQLKREYFVDLADVANWFTGPELYLFGAGVEAIFLSLTQITGTNYWRTNVVVDPSVYTGAIVLRRDQSTNTWWNQTPDISFESDNGAIKNCIKIYDSKDGEGKQYYSWTPYIVA